MKLTHPTSASIRATQRATRVLQRRQRRATAIVAVIVTMVMVQAVVISVVMLGSQVQNLTLVRVESAKAQYAAEAGMNMALRELYNNADEDGDGTIGSISNDGNSANDPQIGGAYVVVTLSVSGSVTTLIATARTTNTQRRITVTLS